MEHSTPHSFKTPNSPQLSEHRNFSAYSSPSPYTDADFQREPSYQSEDFCTHSMTTTNMSSTLGLSGLDTNDQSALTTNQSWRTANNQYRDASISHPPTTNFLPAEYDPFAPYTPTTTSYSSSLHPSALVDVVNHPTQSLASETTSQRSSFSSAPLSEVITQAGSVHSYTPRIKTEEPTEFSIGDNNLVLSPPQFSQGYMTATPLYAEGLASSYYNDQAPIAWPKLDYTTLELPSISSLPIPQYDRRIEGRESMDLASAGPQRKMSTSIARTRQPRRLTTKEEANFQCTVKGCGKLFGRSYNYKAHMETHDAGREYPFPCIQPDCEKRFVRKTDLQRHHQSVHMKQRNFRCDYCSRLFARKDTLRRHMEDGCSKRFEIEVGDYQAQRAAENNIVLKSTSYTEDTRQHPNLPLYASTLAYAEPLTVPLTQHSNNNLYATTSSAFSARADHMNSGTNNPSAWHG